MTALNIQQPSTRDMAATVTALQGWFEARLGWPSPRVVRLDRPTSGGSANETLLVDVTVGSQCRGLVVRVLGTVMVPYFDPSLERQARVMTWAGAHAGVPVPSVLAVESSPSVLGAPFMVMERIEGASAPDYPGYNRAGFLYEASPVERAQVWSDAVATLARLHTADTATIDFLGAPGSGSGLERLVAYWRASFEWMASLCDVEPLAPYLTWIEQTVPSDAPAGLSWGDARIGNMLFAGGRCVAVLDWEMASLGGPLVDLAWWLMFDVIHATDLDVPRLDGLGSRAQTIDLWQSLTQLDPAHLRWHEVFVHVQLALGRTVAFAQRARAGLAIPGPHDPRSVGRLAARLDDLLA